MNPLIRHFIPSIVRGVYRVDEDFSEIEDSQTFERFVQAKLKFLPQSLAATLRDKLHLDNDFEKTKHQQTLPDELFEGTRTTKQRANAFFQLHPYFENAFVTQKDKEADNYLEIQFVRRILARLLTDAGLERVRPQLRIGPYYIDFAIEGASRFAIEVDGFGKFKHRRDLDDFMKRQNYISGEGWRIIRFTYSQIMFNDKVTLKSLHSLFEDDPKLRTFLSIQWNAIFQQDLFANISNPSVIEIVNDFYHVQDWFIEIALSAQQGIEPIRLKDDFGFGVPFVALAISALYEFLDAVQATIEVDLQLPKVTVAGCGRSGARAARLHYLVSTSDLDGGDAELFNTQTVRLNPPSLPVPPHDAGEIRLRRDLSVEEIRHRLDYFCREVFGYEKTKPFQDKVLQRIFDGQHVLGISATGSGKSFCFWLPALLKPGLTLIICPLRSLMRDQRLTLRNYGIASAEFINSDVDKPTQRRILEEAKLGYIRMLYIAPERLRIRTFLEELERLQESVPINYLAVDEAHCISEWGHDFRPSYLKLPFLLETLSERNARLQLIALTATAGQQVEQDMLGILKLRGGEDGHVVREQMADRERFSYEIVTVKEGSTKAKTYQEILTKHLHKALGKRSLPDLLRSINQKCEKSLGIVFCIFADPHGKHSIWDGIAHYLYETMSILEPDACREPGRGRNRKWRLDAYSTGRVRAFASKPPTLCPNCHFYAYTSAPSRNQNTEEDEEENDDEETLGLDKGGIKICSHCGIRFATTDAVTPVTLPKWSDLVQSNQNEFKDSKFDILVATKGFGMGIDKSSVRFIVHTSLSSGLESWYQEVGRAGRDNERAHIVLLVDPPNELCRRELLPKDMIKRPRCSYRGGCPHGRESLCDYGKQHMFIAGSYPGAESDAISALRVLDKLIVAREESNDDSVTLNVSNKYFLRTELSVYRLMVLGLIEDYTVTYGFIPRLNVKLTLPKFIDNPNILARFQKNMQERLADYFSHFKEREGNNIKPQPLENFTAKTQKFQELQYYEQLFLTVYQHLLILLDHTYKDVVKMRYDMLWNLLRVVESNRDRQCRRVKILSHFEGIGSVSDIYRCGCCDVCSPELNFGEFVNPREESRSMDSFDRELAKALKGDTFNREQLSKLSLAFVDYQTSTYTRARATLEGSPNNLSALFIAAEFSPAEEYLGNAKRLLRTANQNPLPLSEIAELYKSSKPFKPELLLALNEAGTACDTVEGWKFLAEQAMKPEQYWNTNAVAMRECLEFMLFVEEDLSDKTESLKHKARELENAFYA